MPTPRRYPDAAARQRAYRDRQREARDAERAAKGLPPAPAVSAIPGRKRWAAMLSQARALLDAARDEMETYADERSEAWQESDRGEAFRETVDALAAVIDDLDALDALTD